MQNDFEDVSSWPVSRYFQEVVAAQPDGRILLFTGKINLVVGALVAASLLFYPINVTLGWIHVGLFLGMPLAGFVWFIRDMPAPQLTRFEHIIRKPWHRKVSALFQLFAGLLPFFVIIRDHVH